MNEIIINGVGAYVPSNIVTNNDLSKIVETSDEWIFERTGIRERRISEGEDTSEIAIKAAYAALKNSDLKPEDIELLIVATITPDMFTPSVACMVQKEIGALNATAFDINAACSGFLYSMQVAEGMMKSFNYKHALIIGAEVLSKIVDWKDRGTCVLFGDGAGAAILSRSNEKGIIKSFTKAYGDKWECLTAGSVDVCNPYVQNIQNKKKFIEMNGREVFRFATSIIQESVNKVLEGTEYSLDDIKYIVPHQANVRIIDYASKKLGVEKSRFFVNLDRIGNTSSASIPIAVNEMKEKGMLKKGDKIILVGFGGGLTYGSVLIEWKK
ncbi:beta-ketoacyl-ACP synthase III [Clostridium chauvoei]|uniref:Beta-ketoacyl-[acyl-carrier-protein] synthase III n=2 Tax=Clostridium chauvoei TaxID=46867 RepID=S6EJW7_9CLOT|nr:beta-ketoacyl-ACP synthase III [Clostridium chauvoei]ATD54857.1 3-oxoacyl-ACP synthase [Clostridium chauvoei]ATD57464.1 3-oxoacyl-ACP synthase [Clostridium chauvoei]MBX7280532.1 ketoacyl-ACP synthase III [Clostridium chauvoei]MBX7283017.1 ketoacyl-ACP synthase III [Clostridium chauvoei]MBX7285534.1 ketoacyl-ACP synthase III [Clostridium chauvoei]